MELSTLLLLVAFRHDIEEPDLETGLSRISTIVGRDVDLDSVHAVLAELLAAGNIHDPVQLRPGALQCRWHLELTPRGADQVLGLLRDLGKTADDLIGDEHS